MEEEEQWESVSQLPAAPPSSGLAVLPFPAAATRQLRSLGNCRMPGGTKGLAGGYVGRGTPDPHEAFVSLSPPAARARTLQEEEGGTPEGPRRRSARSSSRRGFCPRGSSAASSGSPSARPSRALGPLTLSHPATPACCAPRPGSQIFLRAPQPQVSASWLGLVLNRRPKRVLKSGRSLRRQERPQAACGPGTRGT